MPSIDDLHNAGARVARRAVPEPPSIDSLRAEVAKRRGRKRRVFGSSAAVLGLAIGIPFAAAQIGPDEAVPSLLTADQDGTAQQGQADSTTPAQTEETTVSEADDAPSEPEPEPESEPEPEPEPSEPHPDSPRRGLDRLDDLAFSFDLGDGFAISIETIGGDGAGQAASAAEAAADEIRDIDGITVWIDDNGDSTTLSALVEPDLFVSVTGPSLDMFVQPFNFEPFNFGDFEGLNDLLTPELRERLESGDFGSLFDLGNLEGLDDLEGFEEFLSPELRERLESGDFGSLFDFGDLFNLDKRGFPHPEGEETSVSA